MGKNSIRIKQIRTEATISSEHREALVSMVKQSIEEWKTAYSEAEPYEKGRMLENLIGQAIEAGLGAAAFKSLISC